jgi:hypothetical protein
MAESAQGLWQAGRAAGYRWAADEATRAYSHPLTLDPADRTKLVIEHARQAFGGRCVDQPHAWVRGFV